METEDPAEKLRRLEAVLFVSREPLPSRKLSQLANLADGTEARTLIRRLNDVYDEAGRAFRVEEVAGGYQFMTRRKLASWIRRLQHTPSEVRLSAPAMETLAVVAYRQPVLRADIEAVRGVNCGEILRQLMERNLVRISGRSDELGRPYLYSTTKRFLQLFGLRNLEQLPRVDQLRDGAAETSTDSNVIRDDRPKEESDVSVSLASANPAATIEDQELAGATATLNAADETVDVESNELEDDEYDDDDYENDGDDDGDDDEDDEDYGDQYDDDDEAYEDDDEEDEDYDEDYGDDDGWEEVEDDDEDDDSDDSWESEYDEDDEFDDDDEEEEDDYGDDEDAGEEDEDEDDEWD